MDDTHTDQITDDVIGDQPGLEVVRQVEGAVRPTSVDVQKVLETAGIKSESVVSDVMGKAARRMIEALVAGERAVDAMAEMALADASQDRRVASCVGGPFR